MSVNKTRGDCHAFRIDNFSTGGSHVANIAGGTNCNESITFDCKSLGQGLVIINRKNSRIDNYIIGSSLTIWWFRLSKCRLCRQTQPGSSQGGAGTNKFSSREFCHSGLLPICVDSALTRFNRIFEARGSTIALQLR